MIKHELQCAPLIDYNFITDRLAVGNVASRAVPGFVAVVTLLHTERPGLICDELRGAPAVAGAPLKVQSRETYLRACHWNHVGMVEHPAIWHVDIGDGESRAFGRDMHDLDEYLDDACEHIAANIRRGCVLVHCGAGVSRSAAIVVAYLCRYAGMSYCEALALVKLRRPQVAPCDAFEHAVKRWLRLDDLATMGPRR